MTKLCSCALNAGALWPVGKWWAYLRPSQNLGGQSWNRTLCKTWKWSRGHLCKEFQGSMEKCLEGRHGFQVGISPWPCVLLHRRKARTCPSKCRVQGRVSSWLGLKVGLPESKRNLTVIIWSIDGKSEKEHKLVRSIPLTCNYLCQLHNQFH